MGTMKTEDRFMQYVQTIPWCGCWLWLGGRNFRIGGHGSPSHSPHKAAYLLFVGDVDELVPVRECDSHGCVNPDHHFLLDVSTAHSMKMERTNSRMTPEQRRANAVKAGTVSTGKLSHDALIAKMKRMRASQNSPL